MVCHSIYAAHRRHLHPWFTRVYIPMAARRPNHERRCADCGTVSFFKDGHVTANGRFYCACCHRYYRDQVQQLQILGMGKPQNGKCHNCKWSGTVFVAEAGHSAPFPTSSVVTPVMCGRCWENLLITKRQKLAISCPPTAPEISVEGVKQDKELFGVPLAPALSLRKELDDDIADIIWLSDKAKDPLGAKVAGFEKAGLIYGVWAGVIGGGYWRGQHLIG